MGERESGAVLRCSCFSLSLSLSLSLSHTLSHSLSLLVRVVLPLLSGEKEILKGLQQKKEIWSEDKKIFWGQVTVNDKDLESEDVYGATDETQDLVFSTSTGGVCAGGIV